MVDFQLVKKLVEHDCEWIQHFLHDDADCDVFVDDDDDVYHHDDDDGGDDDVYVYVLNSMTHYQ